MEPVDLRRDRPRAAAEKCRVKLDKLAMVLGGFYAVISRLQRCLTARLEVHRAIPLPPTPCTVLTRISDSSTPARTKPYDSTELTPRCDDQHDPADARLGSSNGDGDRHVDRG
jgi:hypothetical protein